MQEERESMELDVLYIGAGMANLASAYRLKTSVDAYNATAAAQGKKAIEEPTILVIDKGDVVGNHTLSGAVVDPVAFKELFPDLKMEEMPFLTPVTSEKILRMSKGGSIPIPAPFLPREMHNDGCYLASISEMTRWLAKKCEEVGVEVYTEFAATELMRDGDKVVGAKIADKGLDHHGEPGESFAPGMDLLAKVTVIGEGTRGFLAQRMIKDFGLDTDSNPQVWGLGVKELIEIPAGRVKAGAVIHTMGYPLDLFTYGGSFIYALSDTLLAIGLVFGLDYRNPLFESHGAFLQFKAHPTVAQLIAGGKVVEYGAKTLPEGGYYAMPRFAVNGAVMVGDSAGFLNCMRLKGVHLAMKSGMMAADRIIEALAADDFSAAKLDYKTQFESSWAGREMHHSRNFRQGFHGGMIPGMIGTGLHMISNGAIPSTRQTMPADFKSLKPATAGKAMAKVKTDDKLFLDILTDVYKSGAVHREDQQPHCRITDTSVCQKCRAEYNSPCTRFCPAQVYEDKLGPNGEWEGIQVNFANCLHCKTCEIKDPFENVKWFPPEGGEGPKYQKM